MALILTEPPVLKQSKRTPETALQYEFPSSFLLKVLTAPSLSVPCVLSVPQRDRHEVLDLDCRASVHKRPSPETPGASHRRGLGEAHLLGWEGREQRI